jgi:hypothetical protein
MRTAQQVRALASATWRIDDFSTAIRLVVARSEAVILTEQDKVLGWVDPGPGSYEIDVPGLVPSGKVPQFPLFVSAIARRYVVSIPPQAVAHTEYTPVHKAGNA